jgi:hypothetical protein
VGAWAWSRRKRARLVRTAVYVERGGADDHRHDQPMAARPPG